MKIVICKDWRDKDIWGSVPVRWTPDTNPFDVLATFKSRCQAWGLLRSEKADLLIINVPASWYEERAQSHEDELRWDATKALWPEIMLDNAGFYRLHIDARQTDPVDAKVNRALADDCPTQGEVDWGAYDVVICTSPWLSAETIRKFPRTVFAYWNYSATWEYFISQQRGTPYDDAYDLHLDHIEGPDFVRRIPQTVYFPYPTNPQVADDFGAPRKTIISTGQRTLDENPEIRAAWTSCNMDGLKTEPPPGKYGGKRMNGLDYFRTLARSKYLVHARNKWTGSGQKVLEAAALDVIVIGYQYGKSFNRIVHPACKIEVPYLFPARERGPFGPVGCPWDEVRWIIEHVEGGGRLLDEVLEHQRHRLESEYNRCIHNLERAVELKRG